MYYPQSSQVSSFLQARTNSAQLSFAVRHDSHQVEVDLISGIAVCVCVCMCVLWSLKYEKGCGRGKYFV